MSLFERTQTDLCREEKAECHCSPCTEWNDQAVPGMNHAGTLLGLDFIGMG